MAHPRPNQAFRVLCVLICGLVELSLVSALQCQAGSKDEESCRAFVQQFYDWYVNPYVSGGQGPAWYDVGRLKPQILSPELRRLLKKESDEQKACGCIDHLDSDPFVNSQDPDRRYVVKGVSVADGRCNATVDGTTEVRPELMRTVKGWVFVNFHYSYYSEDGKRKLYPDNDLIHLLER